MVKEKILVVVESPAKSKTIQKYLGDDYVVRATRGHISDLVTTKSNPLGVDVENGFKPTYAIIPDKKDVVAAIVDAAKHASQIFLATDPDREGHAISHFVAKELKTNVPIKRVLFHEITAKGIKKGISDPQEMNKDIFDAQQARRVLDRLVGFMVSPFLNKMIKEGTDGVLSAGRVQSVAVRMIVDREREIENFKPEEYWSITAALAKIKTSDGFVARYLNKITNTKDAAKIKADLDKDSYTVLDVVAEEKAKKPPAPLETATLQQLASKRFKIPSARSMKAAQTLYESGLVTYIRTDSVRCSPESVQSLREWLSANGFDVPNKPVAYAAKGAAQDAHEAIRPTSVEKQPLDIMGTDDEKKVYQIIWERFITSQMKPALYDTVSVTVKSSSDHILRANGRVLKYKGWLEIVGEIKDKDDEEAGGKLPILNIGDKLQLIPPKVKTEQKFTQPPSRYKEHSLVEELKARGIGRPSTYAVIISKLTDRNYVEKQKDTFHATDLGKRIVDSLVKYFNFVEYKYTADMEVQLDKIEAGEISYLQMLNGFFPEFQTQLKKAYSENEKDYGFKCEKCNSVMRLRNGKFGYFLTCSEYPKCVFNISVDLINGKPVPAKPNFKPNKPAKGIHCPSCNGDMTVRKGKFGPFYACLNYPRCVGTAKIIK